MTTLDLRPASSCRHDIVSLGEVMLRLDPGERRIRTARTFHAWEGGGEYNVARGLRRVFGQRAAIVTALVDNEIGHLIEDLILNGGVDTRWIQWVGDDGIGLSARNGLNFTERGFGVRGALGVSDRGHSATSLLRPGDVDFGTLFTGEGSRWFHTGGIFAALSESTAEVAIEAMQAARRHGAIVSYDLNYRPSLWRGRGGLEAAQQCNRRAVQFADVLFGNEEDFAACLGYHLQGVDHDLSVLPIASYASMVTQVAADYPNLSVIATSLRTVRSATRNDWGGLAWSAATGVVQATQRDGLEILDRVGGGDSFAAGLIFGILDGQPLSTALEYGVAHGALAMTTPGDTSMATLGEVERLMRGGDARVNR